MDRRAGVFVETTATATHPYMLKPRHIISRVVIYSPPCPIYIDVFNPYQTRRCLTTIYKNANFTVVCGSICWIVNSILIIENI